MAFSLSKFVEVHPIVSPSIFYDIDFNSDFFQVQFIFLLKGRKTPLSNSENVKVSDLGFVFAIKDF